MDAYQAGVIAPSALASGLSGRRNRAHSTWLAVWMKAPRFLEFHGYIRKRSRQLDDVTVTLREQKQGSGQRVERLDAEGFEKR
jgi:hypothetical protein